jgi:hypothetical protein
VDDAVKELIEKAEVYLDTRGVDWEDCDDVACPCQKTKDLTEKLRAAIAKVREEMAFQAYERKVVQEATAPRPISRIIRPTMVVRGNLRGK